MSLNMSKHLQLNQEKKKSSKSVKVVADFIACSNENLCASQVTRKSLRVPESERYVYSVSSV